MYELLNKEIVNNKHHMLLLCTDILRLFHKLWLLQQLLSRDIYQKIAYSINVKLVFFYFIQLIFCPLSLSKFCLLYCHIFRTQVLVNAENSAENICIHSINRKEMLVSTLFSSENRYFDKNRQKGPQSTFLWEKIYSGLSKGLVWSQKSQHFVNKRYCFHGFHENFWDHYHWLR